jgi:hypothetical protein
LPRGLGRGDLKTNKQCYINSMLAFHKNLSLCN